MCALIRSFGVMLILSCYGSAASVVATSVCHAGTVGDGSAVTSGTTGCYLLSNGGVASASNYSNLSISGNALVLSTGAYVLAGGSTFRGYGYASTSITTTLQIGTDGPIRDGLVFGNFIEGQTNNGAVSTYSISANPDYFGPGFVVGYSYPRTVRLGTPLTITTVAGASGGASFSDEGAGGGPGLTLLLSFFEADGITPVAIADVPEPRWLMFMGLIGISAATRGVTRRRF